MGSPISLRIDYDATTLRRLAKRCRDTRQARRMLSLAAVYDGMNRTEAARVGGMDRQTLRDWVIRFNSEGPEGLTDRPRPGGPSRLTDAQLIELQEIVDAGPDPDTHGVIRWRRADLASVIEDRFGLIYSERGISALLARLSFSRITGRPQHPAQDPKVIEDFKKTSTASSKPT
jgi:transposase